MNWLIRLLLRPTFEVRVANTKSGRNLVGQRYYQGDDYRDARKVFDRRCLMAKESEVVTLKAVSTILTGGYLGQPTQPEETVEKDSTEVQGHTCNTAGPLRQSAAGGFRPSCTVCGEVQEV